MNGAEKPSDTRTERLDAWLRGINARRTWRAGRVECWAANGSLFIVVMHSKGQGWDIYTACSSTSITESLADASARLGLQDAPTSTSVADTAASLSPSTVVFLLAFERSGIVTFSTAGVSGSLFGGSATAALERRGIVTVDRSHWRDHSGRFTDFGRKVLGHLRMTENAR